MQINNDLKSTMNLEMQSNLKKKMRVNAKEDSSKLRESVSNLKNNETKIGVLGKASSKLEELNKQKVTPELLEKTVGELKKEESSKSGELIEASSVKSTKKKIFDPRDKNRDGKVSASEKHDSLNGIKKFQDKNKDGVVSEQEKQKVQDKTTGLIKEVINELKKEDNFKEINPEQFKGISKMINREFVDVKSSEKINKFLED